MKRAVLKVGNTQFCSGKAIHLQHLAFSLLIRSWWARVPLRAAPVLGSCPVNPCRCWQFPGELSSITAGSFHTSLLLSALLPYLLPHVMSSTVHSSFCRAVHTALQLQQELGHRIPEQLGLERTLLIIWLQPYCHRQGFHSPDTAEGTGPVLPSLVPQPGIYWAAPAQFSLACFHFSLSVGC